MILTHSDCWTPIVNFHCPKCGLAPDMQSTEFREVDDRDRWWALHYAVSHSSRPSDWGAAACMSRLTNDILSPGATGHLRAVPDMEPPQAPCPACAAYAGASR